MRNTVHSIITTCARGPGTYTEKMKTGFGFLNAMYHTATGCEHVLVFMLVFFILSIYNAC